MLWFLMFYENTNENREIQSDKGVCSEFCRNESGKMSVFTTEGHIAEQEIRELHLRFQNIWHSLSALARDKRNPKSHKFVSHKLV